MTGLDPRFADPGVLERLADMVSDRVGQVWHDDPDDPRFVHPGPVDECHPCNIPAFHARPVTR